MAQAVMISTGRAFSTSSLKVAGSATVHQVLEPDARRRCAGTSPRGGRQADPGDPPPGPYG